MPDNDNKDTNLLTDERVIELQEEWNPKQYEKEEPGFVRDMLIRVATEFYNMSPEEYREVLMNRVDEDIA